MGPTVAVCMAVAVKWIASADGHAAMIATHEEPVFGIVPEEGPKAMRVGIDLAAPVREATLTLVITPSLPHESGIGAKSAP